MSKGSIVLRKSVYVLLLFCLTSLALALPIYNPSHMETIKKRGYIRVGILNEDYPPYAMHNKQGQYVGIDISIVREIANLLGVKVVYDTSASTYDTFLKNMYDRKDDIIISALVSVPSRAKSLLFTIPYYRSSIGLLINRVKYDNLENDKVPEFNSSNITIGVVTASAYKSYIHYIYPKAKIVVYKSAKRLLHAVVQGKLDGCMMDDLFIKAWLAEKPQRALRTRYILLSGYYANFAIATSYRYPIFGKWLNNVIQNMNDIGFFNRLLNKYAATGKQYAQ